MARSKGVSEPKLGKDVYIDVSAIVTGDVEIGDYSSVWPHAVLRGDIHRVVVGKYTNIQDLSILHVGEEEPCIVGDYVVCGHNVCLHGCVVGNGVLIGIGAIVLSNAKVEDRVMIGAGSLVPEGKVLESGYLYYGAPVKKIRRLRDQEIQENIDWAKKYAENARRHLRGDYGRIGLLVSGE